MDDVNAISGLAPPRTTGPTAPASGTASPLIARQMGEEFQRVLAQAPGAAGPDVTAEAKAAREFETMVISSFLSDAFKSANSTAFGEGFQGEFYSQIFTRAVAESIVDNGGFGIAAMIEKR